MVLGSISGIVGVVTSFFAELPTAFKFLTISAILFLDSQTNVVGGTFTFFTQWIGITVDSFVLFMIAFVASLIYIMASTNSWFGSG